MVMIKFRNVEKKTTNKKTIVTQSMAREAKQILLFWVMMSLIIASAVTGYVKLANTHTGYVIETASKQEALLADGANQPVITWRKNRHGEPNARSITLQLRSLANCPTKPIAYSTSRQGSRWETLTIRLDYPSGNPTVNNCGKKNKWTWKQWIIREDSKTSKNGKLLPLDEVTALYLDYGDGKKPVMIPQYKTQMDKLDKSYQ